MKFVFCHGRSYLTTLYRRLLRCRLCLRIAFFFARRRCSLLGTNQRFFRTALNLPLFATFLRKRLSSCSGDSFFLRVTFVIFFLYGSIFCNLVFPILPKSHKWTLDLPVFAGREIYIRDGKCGFVMFFQATMSDVVPRRKYLRDISIVFKKS